MLQPSWKGGGGYGSERPTWDEDSDQREGKQPRLFRTNYPVSGLKT
jgi:hypothetical protein